MALVVLALGKPMLMLFGPGLRRRLSRCCSCWSLGVVARAAVGPCESLLTMSGNQNICAAVYALTLALNIGAERRRSSRCSACGARRSPPRSSMIFEAAALSFTVWRKLGIVMAIFVPAPKGSALMAAVPLARGDERQPVRRDDRRPRRACRQRSATARISSCWKATGRRAGSPSIRPPPASTWSRSSTICAPARSSPTSSSTRASWRRRCRAWRTARCGSPSSATATNTGAGCGCWCRSRSSARPMPLGVSIMRTWSSPFGPLGTPLVDRDDPDGVIEDFFAMLSRPHLKLPKVFVLPDMRLDGAVASLLGSGRRDARPAAGDHQRGRAALPRKRARRRRLSEGVAAAPHHLREFRRLKRRLADKGKLEHIVARGAGRHPPRPSRRS